MSSKNSNIPLLTQQNGDSNGHHQSYDNGDYSYSKSKYQQHRDSSIGGAEHSMTKSTFHEFSQSKGGYDVYEHRKNIPYQLEQSEKNDDDINHNHPSALYLLFIFLLGCIIIFIGAIFNQNLFFDLSDEYVLDMSYFLIIIAFGSSLISYSIWNVFQIYFNCCIKNLNMSGFGIFWLILGVCLMILSVIGFLDEYVDSYDNYEIVTYPIYVIFILFGLSIMSLIICWIHIKYKQKFDKAMKLKNFYFNKMLNEEGDKSDYKLPENRDKLPSYIKKNGIIHPYDRSIISMIWHTLTHSWLFGIIYLGSKKTLESYDMYLPPKGDDIEYNMNKWLLESEKYKRENPNKPFSSWKV